jgi:ABC-type multidrug transport system permease subunit
MLILYGQALRRAVRTPFPLLSATVGPLAVLWFLDQLLGRLPGVVPSFPTQDYLAFSAPALAVAGGLPCAMWCGAAVGRDAQSGFLDCLLTTPVPRALIAVGAALAAATSAAISALLVLAASVAAGVAVSGGGMGVLSITLLAAALSCLYAALAWIIMVLVPGQTAGKATCIAVLVGTLLLCDLLLPSSLLPVWLRATADANPLSAAIDGARAVAWPRTDWHEWTRDLSAVSALAIVALVGAAAVPHPRGGQW